MSPTTTPAQVFISYSHKDSEFFDELLKHMSPYERAGIFTAWNDKKIVPGSGWSDAIKTALTSAKVAVLLVSPDFLESNFIHEHELEPLLAKAERGGVCILWVLLRACSYEETPISRYHAAYSIDRPLAKMNAERDDAWVDVCKTIKEAVARSTSTAHITPLPNGRTPVATSSPPNPPIVMQSSPLVGLPGQSPMDRVLLAAGGSPISPMGSLLYGKK